MQTDLETEAGGRPKSDGILLQEYITNGSQEAFRQIYDRYRPFVLRKCLRAAWGNTTLAEDGAQAVFVVLSVKAKQLTTYSYLGGWLSNTVSYTMANILRREKTRLGVIAASSQTSETRVDDRFTPETWAEIEQAIQTLPARLRDVIELRYLQGKSASEVAAVFDCTDRSVRLRIKTGIEMVRRRLERRGLAVSMVAVVAELEAEAGSARELTGVGQWPVEVCSQEVRTTADRVMAEMDRVAAKATWRKIGAVTVGLATIGLGTALVVSHVQKVEPVVTWRIESYTGYVAVRRDGTMRAPKMGDALCHGDFVITTSNEEVTVVSSVGDRVLLREEGEFKLETGNWKLATEANDGNLPPSILHLLRGAVVAQVKHPARFATPHAAIQSDAGSFFLMVASGLTSNSVQWSFSRMDVTEGQVLFRSSGTQVPSFEFPLSPFQFVSAGTNHIGKAIVPVTRRSDGREMSPKYGGVFFLDCAKTYESGRFVFDTMDRMDPGKETTLSATDLVRTARCSVGVKMDTVVRDGKSAVSLRSSSPEAWNEVAWSLFSNGTHVCMSELEFYPEASVLIQTSGTEDFVPPALFLASDWRPEASLGGDLTRRLDGRRGKANLVRDDFLCVGSVADGSSVLEVRTVNNGKLYNPVWFVGEVTGRIVKFKGKELLVSRITVGTKETGSGSKH